MKERTASFLFVISAILIIACGTVAAISAAYRYQSSPSDPLRAVGALAAILGGSGLAGIGLARLLRLASRRGRRPLGRARTTSLPPGGVGSAGRRA